MSGADYPAAPLASKALFAAGLVATAIGAHVERRRSSEAVAVRGPPPCQEPDCTDDATAESGRVWCPAHGRGTPP